MNIGKCIGIPAIISVLTVFVVLLSSHSALIGSVDAQLSTVPLSTNETAGSDTNTTETTILQNQSSVLANLSLENFEEVTEDLQEAREALESNDTTTAYAELTSADLDLYEITDTQEQLDQGRAIAEQLSTLHKRIINGLEALWNYDTTQTLRQLNAADRELANVTQNLPGSDDND